MTEVIMAFAFALSYPDQMVGFATSHFDMPVRGDAQAGAEDTASKASAGNISRAFLTTRGRQGSENEKTSEVGKLQLSLFNPFEMNLGLFAFFETKKVRNFRNFFYIFLWVREVVLAPCESSNMLGLVPKVFSSLNLFRHQAIKTPDSTFFFLFLFYFPILDEEAPY